MLRSIFSISNQARSPSKAGAVLVSTSAAGLAWHDHIAQTQTSRYFSGAEGPNFGVAPESASGHQRTFPTSARGGNPTVFLSAMALAAVVLFWL